MIKWIATTDDFKFCQITFDGSWYRTKVENEFGDQLLDNESISLDGAKKQIKRCIGTGHKLKWSEMDYDNLEITGKLRLPTGYLSVSQVRKYLKCPKQYQYKYIDKLKEDVGSGLILGRAFHKGMQTASIRKVIDGEIMDTSDVLDVYSTAFDDEIENQDVEWKEDEDPGKIKDEGSKLMAVYYDELGRDIVPMVDDEGLPYVERKHTFEMVPGLPVFQVMDLIDADGIIRDYKTSAKSPSKNVLDDGIQLPTYALGYRDLFGQQETKVGLDYAVNLKTKKKTVRIETDGPVSAGDIERTVETFVGVAKGINAGIFYPNDESNSCGYCSFREICRKSAKH